MERSPRARINHATEYAIREAGKGRRTNRRSREAEFDPDADLERVGKLVDAEG